MSPSETESKWNAWGDCSSHHIPSYFDRNTFTDGHLTPSFVPVLGLNKFVKRLGYDCKSRCQNRRPSQITRVVPRASTDSYTTLFTVPTGIGAAIGGYAGDAIPALRLISSIADTVITHPNVLNGALMYWPIQNALYVEGFALDRFASRKWALKQLKTRSNRVGVVFDAAMDSNEILRHKQAAEAARATLGLQITNFCVTSKPLNVSLSASVTGASWGSLSNPASLLQAAESLLQKGCQAIAVVAKFPDDEDEDQLAEYRAGHGVDAIAGAEAVISHLITRELSVPCAHAPSLPPLDVDESVSPKSAAEELGYTFLSCVLVGLSKAPQLVPAFSASRNTAGITADHVDSVIVPANSFGGSAVMSLAANPNVLVVAVTENSTALNVSPQSVGIDPSQVLFARSYAEAAGYIAAHKVGLDIPSLSCTVPRLAAE